MAARRQVLEYRDIEAVRAALDVRPRVTQVFAPGDDVAVWRRGRGAKKGLARWRGSAVDDRACQE